MKFNLKPFEIAVKEGGAKAVMSSFNYIGTQWAGGTYPLQTTVLRDEWGFRGFVLTDYFGVYGYMDSDMGIRGGTDCMLVAYDTETNHVTDTTSATGVKAMRQASKNIMYTVGNSRAYDPENLKTRSDELADPGNRDRYHPWTLGNLLRGSYDQEI